MCFEIFVYCMFYFFFRVKGVNIVCLLILLVVLMFVVESEIMFKGWGDIENEVFKFDV